MTMTLINGPYHGRQIQDLGTVRQKMSIYRPLPDGRIKTGCAIYEPSPDRSQSFWLENIWDGSTLIPLDEPANPSPS
jgi:hypothetical protein